PQRPRESGRTRSCRGAGETHSEALRDLADGATIGPWGGPPDMRIAVSLDTPRRTRPVGSGSCHGSRRMTPSVALQAPSPKGRRGRSAPPRREETLAELTRGRPRPIRERVGVRSKP